MRSVVLILVFLLLVSGVSAELFSLIPSCGEYQLYEQGVGGNHEYVMENDCLLFEMRSLTYDPTISVYDKLNDRSFIMMANMLQERDLDSQNTSNITFTSMGLTSDINDGYVRWSNSNVMIGYKLVGNTIKMVGEINDYNYVFSNSDLWLDVRTLTYSDDVISWIPVIVDGVEQPIVVEERTAGINNFMSQKLGRGQNIIIDPIYYTDYNPIPARFYENGNQFLSGWLDFDAPSTVTTTLTDGNTETKVTITKKATGDDDVLRLRFNQTYDSNYQYFIRFYKRNNQNTNVLFYPHKNATNVELTVNKTQNVVGTGWKEVNVTGLVSNMTGLGYLDFRMAEWTDLDKIEVSEVMLRKQVNDSVFPVIANCSVSVNNFSCGENTIFSCYVTDNSAVGYVAMTINGVDYLGVQNGSYYYVNITNNLSGIVNYAMTSVEACDIFNNCDDNSTFLNSLYSCETCVEDWIPYYNNLTSCRVNNTLLQEIYYLDDNSCGTTIDLPLDNGSVNSVFCDYCVPEWLDIGSDCAANFTRYVEYEEVTTCYSVTNLSSDAPPLDNGTRVYCEYLQRDFTCVISDNPYLKKKNEFTCFLPFSPVEYDCLTFVTSDGNDTLQVNPQKEERNNPFISFDAGVESRESFVTNNGLLNAYYSDKRLVADHNFVVHTVCSNGSVNLHSLYEIEPSLQPLAGVPVWLIWARENAGYLLGLGFIILVLSWLLFMWIKGLRGAR